MKTNKQYPVFFVICRELEYCITRKNRIFGYYEYVEHGKLKKHDGSFIDQKILRKAINLAKRFKGSIDGVTSVNEWPPEIAQWIQEHSNAAASN